MKTSILAAILLVCSGVMVCPIEGVVHQLRNAATNRCLDSDARWLVYTQPCNGGDYQKWDLIPQEGSHTLYSYFFLKNVKTGVCAVYNFLDNGVHGSPDCSAIPRFTWTTSTNSNYLENVAASGKCIDGDHLDMNGCSDANTQQWIPE